MTRIGGCDEGWGGKRVLVLGLGATGLSCVRHLAARGAVLRAADARAAPPGLAAARDAVPGLDFRAGDFDEGLLEGVDAVAPSPGVARAHPVLRAADARGLDVAGDIEILAREMASEPRRPRVIGVTGTNGKSTVTALAGDMARAAGLSTVVAGNIGEPVLDALAGSRRGAAPDCWVIELSSYQLETTASLALDAGAMLNLTQDHLDRYGSMAEYGRAKARIFRHCASRVLNRDDAASLAMAGGRTVTFGLGRPAGAGEWGIADGHLVEGGETIASLDEMPVAGLHNAANALAAHALCREAGMDAAPLREAILAFRGLPHRAQAVAEARGVAFLDDSKGTNVGATVAALEGLSRPAVLIAGGDGKGQDFTPLAAAVKAKARAVVVIGRDGPRVADALAATGVPVERAATMPEAVEAAYRLAKRGDAVLLSPACASLDMFSGYAERGRVFAEAARALAAREGA